MKRPPSLGELQRACMLWNAAHPIGTDVTVRLDGGDRFATKTRSAAHMLSGHSAVIWLEGISGCYALERVMALAGQEAE